MATAQTICYRSDSYRNWVRGSVGLGYLQEGLQVFAETIVQTEHRNILQRIGKCGKCSIESIMPAHAKQGHCIQKNRRRCNCTKKGNIYCAVCSKMYDEIIIQHRFIDPNWEIDSAGLFSDHWQFAKCFMTTTKKESNNTAAETDAACLLSIIINGNFFQAELDTIIDGENDIFSQAKKVSNAILHSSKLELTEDEVTEYLKTMIDVLQDRKVLMNDKAAQTAVTKITYKKSAFESARRSIKGTGESCENRLKELTLRSEEIIEGKTSQSIAEISRAKEDAIDEIEKNKPKDRNASGAGIAIGQEHHQDMPVQDQEAEARVQTITVEGVIIVRSSRFKPQTRTEFPCQKYFHAFAVLRENAEILNDIAQTCKKKKTEHTDNTLLTGRAGSGKSALINTIITALSGRYIQRAKCGYGKTGALTNKFQRFENCGITEDDIADADRRNDLKYVVPYLPSLVDSPPLGGMNTTEQMELLELVIGGYIPPVITIKSLCKLQQENYPGFLNDKFAESNPEWRITKSLFVKSPEESLDQGLIKMVKDLLQKKDQERCCKKSSDPAFSYLDIIEQRS